MARRSWQSISILTLGLAALATQRGTPTFAQVNTGTLPGDFVTEVPDGDSWLGIRATISCPAGGGLCKGTTADDVIVGSSKDDLIYASGGDDIVCGGLGKDTIFGEDGDDL